MSYSELDLENIEFKALLAGILHSMPFKRMSEKFASY